MENRNVTTGDVERRFVSLDNTRVEVRGEGDEPSGIGGLGIPVEKTADIGPFTESISREAVEDAIEQGWDVRGLFNHDPNMVLGRTNSGTMTLTASDDGLEFDIPDMPKARADVMEAIGRGDVDGNSFSFTVGVEEWDDSGDKPHRTIKRFGQLFDVGPVTFPAYEGHTVVSTRAMDHVTSEARTVTEGSGEPTNTDTVKIETNSESEPEIEQDILDNLTPRQRQLAANDAWLAGLEH